MPHPSNGTKLDCPVHLVLSYIGSKWAILILQELFQGSRRTNEFLSALPGISTKTLTARLRELESYGLVKRTVFPEVPPRVEYSLTAKGREVQPIMAALNQVGQHWLVHSPGDSCSDPPRNRPATRYGPRSR
ncbi:helix-turn-helix transcriptional regulator [Nodosilinea sp. LEGE 07298]|jgi:DNA-binding HxlR family transcriptional regulator|uniref:winged helix-turn-helix transcriptional regulator n=1 Tax=Nodosilinea sp. LEGE 07298 TaxID=2777970 RepID=UPI0018822624|nr:helix-turn-helix domain-containing protein [Nodosilinea sp. LEGE 07298]MBE9108950.1 helix-turn-helix transcriptional regulator [Nodosilinea sp. LEGE 07298]